MTTYNNSKNEKLSAGIAIGIHALLLLLFFFMVVFKPPFELPVPPGGGTPGVVLNIGFSSVGMGEEQTAEEVAEEVSPSEQNLPEYTDKSIESIATTDDPESYVIDEKKDKVEKETKPVDNKKNPDVTKKSTTVKTQVDKAALYPNTGEGNTNQPGNQGDPRGSLDPNASYTGEPGDGGEGGGQGGGIGLGHGFGNGWSWKNKPDKLDEITNLAGTMKFNVTIDEEGNIVNVVVFQPGPFPQKVLEFYKQQIEKSYFELIRRDKAINGNATEIVSITIKAR